MRLIDADALKVRIIEDVPGFLDGGSSITKAFIIAMLTTRNVTPTIDAVQVVRCKDCRYYNSEPDCHGDYCDKIHWSRGPSWYCADGRAEIRNERE